MDIFQLKDRKKFRISLYFEDYMKHRNSLWLKVSVMMLVVNVELNKSVTKFRSNW